MITDLHGSLSKLQALSGIKQSEIKRPIKSEVHENHDLIDQLKKRLPKDLFEMAELNLKFTYRSRLKDMLDRSDKDLIRYVKIRFGY